MSGAAAHTVTFVLYACLVVDGTVRAEVREAGAAAAAATVSQALSVLAIPDWVPAEQRLAQGTSGPVAQAGRPGIVSGIHFDKIMDTSFRVKWSAPSDGGNLTGYGLLWWTGHVQDDKPPYGDATSIGVPTTFEENGINKQAQTLSGLTAGTTYHYLMHACNQTICGHWSYPAKSVTTTGTAPTPVTSPAPAPTTPTSTPAAPDRPHTIKFEDTTSTSVRVTWRAPGNTGGAPLTGFDLRYWPYDSNNPTAETGATTQRADGGSDRSETLRGLDANTTYELKMRACNQANNTNCSRWSADHRFTTSAASPTPPPAAFRFSTAVAAQVYRAGHLISVQLPAATGGSGHVTYTLSPALGNGLSFDGPTRTIAGTPSQAANQATYTYTATDAKKNTVEASVPLTVFNVHLVTWHVDDKTIRRMADGAFLDAIYPHWYVLAYAGVEPREPIARTDGHQFQIRLPAHPGFKPGWTCTGPAAAPTSTETLQTPWIAVGQTFVFARCSLGSGRAATVELWVRDAAGAESLLETRRLGGQQAWHQADHKAFYYVRGTAADGTIELVESASGAGDGLFPNKRPPNLAPTVTPSILLRQPGFYSTAAGIWNAVDGVTVGAAESGAGADTVIKGYWDKAPASEDDGVCGGSIACVYVGGRNGHLMLEMEFFIEDPPRWGEANALTWTISFDEAITQPSTFQYLPAVLVHEFGHVIGLGHSADPSDIMFGKVRPIGCTGSNCGLNEHERKGAEAIYTSPHHAPH